jgi:polyisoprenoid-binding protein YceI
MTRSTIIVLTIAAVHAVALPIVFSQTQAATSQGSKPTPAQKSVKAKDSAATKRAKETQRVKTEQMRPVEIPAGLGGTWAVDPNHSTIGFAVRHVMVNDVHGTFNEFESTIIADTRDVSKSSVEFTAKVASIDTRVAQRDTHLKSADFFDAEKYPEITFKSTRVERMEHGFRATGTLTMHGTAKSVVIPFEARGPVVDGFGYTRMGVAAKLDLNRQDYGVKWNQVLDKGGLAVDNIVHVTLDLEAVKAGTGPKKES